MQRRLWFALWSEPGATPSLWPSQRRCAGSCCCTRHVSQTRSCSCHNPSLTVCHVMGKQDCSQQNLF